MAQPGAAGATAKEFQALLGNDGNPAALKAQAEPYARMSYHVQGRSLLVKNAVWVDKVLTLKPEYQAALKADFAADIRRADFINQAEQARIAINQSAEESTFGRITNLLGPNDLRSDTRLVLLNTAFFRGRWIHQFEPFDTKPAPFFQLDGKSPQIPMMNQRFEFDYLEGEDFQALSMPFEQSETEMLIFLPKEKQGLAAFESGLTAEKLAGWTQRLAGNNLPYNQRPEIILTLPKMKQQDRRALNGPLAQLGLASAFDVGTANFSGIARPSPSDPLYISEVIQQTFLVVDEVGAEAAAATEIGAAAGAAFGAPVKPKPVVFKTDHPFFYLIRDSRSGMILFMGRFLGE